MSRLSWCAVLMSLACVAPTWAGLTISAPAITVAPGGSASFDVLLENDGPSSVALGAFDIQLSLDPLSGVRFAKAELPSNGMPYVFLGETIVKAGIPFSGDSFPAFSFSAGDLTLVMNGETLGPNQTRSLGRVHVEVASSALPGLVVPIFFESGTALHSPMFSDIPAALEAGSIRVGSAPAMVPEPGTLAIGAILALFAGGLRLRRRAG